MRQDRSKEGVRSSALWGKGSGRTAAVLLAFLLALLLPLAATAAPKPKQPKPPKKEEPVPTAPAALTAGLSAGLFAKAQANPDQTFEVIIQGRFDTKSKDVRQYIADVLNLTGHGRKLGHLKSFSVISGVSTELTGREILALARFSSILAITEDSPMVLDGPAENPAVWPYAVGAQKGWAGGTAKNLPAIAVVDSGIDASRSDFGGRVVANVNLTSLTANSAGDGRGHGTFVASIAAGSARGHYGVATRAPIVSLDVMDDNGMAMTSDVIAAADWLVANKDKYNIRVANFSLHTARPTTILFDPLNAAVERLWLSGVVVVASAT